MQPKFFKNYFIIDALGEGGMSKVFLAFDLKTLQFVAIKFLHQNIQENEMFLARLRREVDIYRQLHHKNVIGLVEDALDESPPYMVLEYIRGAPLNELIQKHGRLPAGTTFQVLSDLTEALHATHRAGIVHRDLQPGNVILTYMGWVKVLDYGIAKRDDNLLDTEPGAIMGTVIYSAPEQNMGASVDSRADMYSLGLILFEMLTGRRALRGRNIDEIRQEQTDDLDPPSEVAEDIPDELDEICEMLTQRMADERIENATKLLIELGKLRVGGDDSIEAKLITDPRERRRMAARQAVFEEKWEFVENMCERMQARGEDDAQVTFFRAKACSQLGKHDLADRQYEKAIFQDKENTEYVVDYAVALIKQKKHDKARKILHDVPVGSDGAANVLVRGLIELLAREAEWPDLAAIERERQAAEARRNSFLGRLWGKITGR